VEGLGLVTKEPTLTILSEPEKTDNACALEIIAFEIVILGKAIPFRVGVADEQARLADIVPLARAISTKLALTVIDDLSKNGQSVSCHKSCSACCNYLIPLSVPEVFCLREELVSMSAGASSRILRSCLATAERILDRRLRKSYLEGFSKSGQPQMNQVSKWYAGLELACPFLSDGLCTLYEQRPIACREHMVTSSPRTCKSEESNEPEVVRMPVSVLDALGQFAADLEQSDVEAVMLPLALPWAQSNLERSHRSWPAVTMVERFVDMLKLMASENSAALAR
jgi:Fe-S-cluster containining protein